MEANQVVQSQPTQADNSPKSDNEGAVALAEARKAQGNQPAQQEQSAEEQKPQEPKKYKKTIFGKPVEFTIDQVRDFFKLEPDIEFDERTEKAYIDAYLKNRAGDLKFNDIDHKKREIEQFYTKLKTDMPSLLQEAGIDPTEWALQYLNRQAEEMQMDPREVEYRRMQEEKQAWEEARQQEIMQLQQQQLEAETQQHYDKYMQQIGVALTKAQIPQNETWIISRAAEHLLQQKDMGLDLSFDEAVEFAEQDFSKTAQRMFRNMEPQKIMNILGDEVMRKIRGMELQKIVPQQAVTKQFAPQPQQEKKPMTRDEFEKWKQEKIRAMDGR